MQPLPKHIADSIVRQKQRKHQAKGEKEREREREREAAAGPTAVRGAAADGMGARFHLERSCAKMKMFLAIICRRPKEKIKMFEQT